MDEYQARLGTRPKRNNILMLTYVKHFTKFFIKKIINFVFLDAMTSKMSKTCIVQIISYCFVLLPSAQCRALQFNSACSILSYDIFNVNILLEIIYLIIFFFKDVRWLVSRWRGSPTVFQPSPPSGSGSRLRTCSVNSCLRKFFSQSQNQSLKYSIFKYFNEEN